MSIDKTKNTQILVTMPKELKRDIEDYQYSNRMPSRTAAVLELIQKGIEQDKERTR